MESMDRGVGGVYGREVGGVYGGEVGGVYGRRGGRSLWTEGWVEFNGSEELSPLIVSMSWTWAEF